MIVPQMYIVYSEQVHPSIMSLSLPSSLLVKDSLVAFIMHFLKNASIRLLGKRKKKDF
jgi:hypothetical protein